MTIWRWNLRTRPVLRGVSPDLFAWLALNPIELAVALGLPAVAWCLIGIGCPRSVPRSTWATIGVLALLNLVGRNMGEVPAAWILFVPPLLLAAGTGLERMGARPWALGANGRLARPPNSGT